LPQEADGLLRLSQERRDSGPGVRVLAEEIRAVEFPE
jgi:hypothetical protein